MAKSKFQFTARGTARIKGGPPASRMNRKDDRPESCVAENGTSGGDVAKFIRFIEKRSRQVEGPSIFRRAIPFDNKAQSLYRTYLDSIFRCEIRELYGKKH